MTNLLFFKVVFALYTNWTGVEVCGREVGVVVTNHVLKFEYGGVVKEIVITNTVSSTAVFRENAWRAGEPYNSIVLTNPWRLSATVTNSEPRSFFYQYESKPKP